MFFLAGTGPSVSDAVRTKCVVPAGKALFFPIITVQTDNGGVPPEKTLGEAGLKSVAAGLLGGMRDVSLKVDGASIDTTQLRVDPAAFSYTLPAAPNRRTCLGDTGVMSGPVSPAVDAGYYAMLAPLSAGPHEIEFGASYSGGPPPKPLPFSLHVTYKLVVLDR